MNQEAHELIIVPLSSDIPVDVRLRHVLKSLLRQYRFRCKSIRPIEVQTKQRRTKEHGPHGPSDARSGAEIRVV